MKITLITTVIIFLSLSLTEKGLAISPWPAEAWISATTFTHLNPDFRNNMSGACWNPKKQIFWVCRNGGPSAFWALKYNGAGSLMIATNDSGSQAGYYLRSGDLEAICQVDYDTDFVFLMFEKRNLIRKYDVSVYGKPTLKMQWDISAYVPKKGGGGSEGITFVPNEWLKKEGFVNAGGKPYLSTNGMGGLMFVAHQNGGRIYAFDLNPDNGTVLFVGAYKTSRSESSGLEFDRSTGLLYVWHNLGPNYLEVTKLSSQVEGKERRFTSAAEFVGPKSGNLEGIAIVPTTTKKDWCLIVDDDNQDGAALMLFRQFNP